jgi:hypothetical protein
MEINEIDKVVEDVKLATTIKYITDDANTLVSQSPAAQTAISVLILAERLKVCAEAALHYEVTEAWDVENANKVFAVMRSAAVESAAKQYTAAELFESIVLYALPFVDVLVRSASIKPQETTE